MVTFQLSLYKVLEPESSMCFPIKLSGTLRCSQKCVSLPGKLLGEKF